MSLKSIIANKNTYPYGTFEQTFLEELEQNIPSNSSIITYNSKNIPEVFSNINTEMFNIFEECFKILMKFEIIRYVPELTFMDFMDKSSDYFKSASFLSTNQDELVRKNLKFALGENDIRNIFTGFRKSDLELFKEEYATVIRTCKHFTESNIELDKENLKLILPRLYFLYLLESVKQGDYLFFTYSDFLKTNEILENSLFIDTFYKNYLYFKENLDNLVTKSSKVILNPKMDYIETTVNSAKMDIIIDSCLYKISSFDYSKDRDFTELLGLVALNNFNKKYSIDKVGNYLSFSGAYNQFSYDKDKLSYTYSTIKSKLFLKYE